MKINYFLKLLHENLFNIDYRINLFCIVQILEGINLNYFPLYNNKIYCKRISFYHYQMTLKLCDLTIFKNNEYLIYKILKCLYII